MKNEICLVSGGFDPLHKGHLEYFKEAKKKSNYLVVALNSDEWLYRKKKYVFMPWNERSEIIQSLEVVNEVISFDDSDNSACDAIDRCLLISKKVIFANGGDRGRTNTPEIALFQNNKRVNFLYGIGGNNKINSSSELTSRFFNNFLKILNSQKNIDNIIDISSPWGFHSLIIDNKEYKVKVLSVNPKSQLSLQKHQHREEHWIVVKGVAEVIVDGITTSLGSGNYIHIPNGSEHCLRNNHTDDLIVIEVQLGEVLKESDITRISDIYGRVND